MFVFLASSAGCTSVQEMLPLPRGVKEEPLPVVEGGERLEQLIAYFDLALHMSRKEVEREYAVQQTLLAPDTCNEPRLLAAMLLMNPSLKVSSKKRSPLGPCLDEKNEKENLENYRLARILQVLLDEKGKLQSAQRKLVATRYRVNVLKQEIEDLNEKLEELKRIEDSIRGRE